MAFTPYTTPTKGATYIAPIPIDLIQQGTMFNEGLAQKNLQDISASYNNVFNIPTYGKDKEKIAELEGNLKNELSQMNLANLGNMETASQIKNLISKYSQNKDVMGIAQRYGSYQNELKKKEDAEAKNQTYVSPLLRDAEKYYNSGEYLSDKRFNGTGWNDPQLNKEKQEIIKNAPKIIKNVKQGNYWVSVESPDMDWVKDQYEELYNKPNVVKTREYNFNISNEDRDWVTEGNTELQDGIYKANLALQIDPNDTKAQDYLKTANILLQNPDRLGEISKNKAMKYELDKEKEADIAAVNYESFGKMDADDFDLKYIEHSNKIQEDLFKAQTELFSGLTHAEQQKVRQQGNFNGVNLEQAANKIQENKRKNAAAFNNLNLTSSELIADYTQEDWQKNVFVNKTGVTKIPNSNGAKTMIKNLILSNPEYFTDIPQEVRNNLSEGIIDIVDGNLEIDPSFWNPTAQKYTIDVTDLLKRKNKIYQEAGSSTTPQNVVKEIKLDTGHVIPTDTVEAIRAQLLALGKDTSDASVGIIYKNKFISK